MNYGPSPIDVIDADALQEDIERIVGSLESGRTVTYIQAGAPTHHPSAGVAATEPQIRLIRVYRGGEDSRKVPGADVGTERVIVLKSALQSPSPIEPMAGDHIIDNGQRFAVDNVEFGDVGTTRIYYLLSVTAAGVA